MGSPETTGTTTEDTGIVITTTGTLPSEPSIAEDVSNTAFKMQLETYKRWKKKVKAIKSLDNFVI